MAMRLEGKAAIVTGGASGVDPVAKLCLRRPPWQTNYSLCSRQARLIPQGLHVHTIRNPSTTPPCT